jgi:regulator of sigma E protease
MTIIYALIIFAILIFVHELGHFATAKFFGVKVNEFAIGMGPAFFKKERGETTYSLRAIPIGGFCSLEGQDEDSPDEKAFHRKPAWQRAIILAAGSLMNVVLAVLILGAILFSLGYPSTTIEQVSPNSPAQEAGLIAGDRILAIEGISINRWEEIPLAVGNREPGEKVTLEISRSGAILTVITGTTTGEDGRTVMGIAPAFEKKPFRALWDGAKSTWNMTVSMIDILKQLFTGEVPATELTGPVGIVYMVGDTAKMGASYVAYLGALISLNLAIINLLPFPALDGGRLLFLAIRKVTGKIITDEIESKIHIIGIVLLFGLMIFVTWQDILRFILPHFGG